MSLNKKILLISILVLLAAPLTLRWCYRRAHPAYVPPSPRAEKTLTIIPGWNLRQVAEYLVSQGFASSTRDVYAVTGEPAIVRSRRAAPPFPDAMEGLELISRKPPTLSYEGYLAPETYRVFADATLPEVISKLLAERDKEFLATFPDRGDATTPPLGGALQQVTLAETVTMASIIEKETRHAEDRAIVADILWRRYLKGWALQVDSSVHYIVDRTGDVFTTEAERATDSPWNTYKYPGLPPGPICNPSVESLQAALNPEKNTYWYFLTGHDGVMYYARTLEEHNINRAKRLQ